jgi:GNAT-family acetyltransferase (TIGR03103 family)
MAQNQFRLARPLNSLRMPPPGSWLEQEMPLRPACADRAILECGWGRILFAQTFPTVPELIEAMRQERADQRDIAMYLTDPHIVLCQAPCELFLDPSHTYRLRLSAYRAGRRARGFEIQRLRGREDADEVNRIRAARGMIQVDPEFFWTEHDSRVLTPLVAVDTLSGAVVGTVTGVDHVRAFDDPENGSSLWCLAVDPQAAHPGIGEALVRALAEHYKRRGRSFMDLSVLHDNKTAIALYEKIGFKRVPVFALKTRSPINEQLFAGPRTQARLNPHSTIIINEARRRGLGVEVLDAEANYFRLSLGGRSVACRESLSELTTAVAVSRCEDKAVTRRLLAKAGLVVPDQRVSDGGDGDLGFLKRHGSVVVRPARGEQGQGVTMDVYDPEILSRAIEAAGRFCRTVLLEQHVRGADLRVVVINDRVVAAAIRRPAGIIGTGDRTVAELIEAQSRRRAAATGGESRIPLDAETERCIGEAGYAFGDVLPEGQVLTVRKTADLRAGGTLHDVTDRLNRRLVDASIEAARALEIPVVGLDLIVPDIFGTQYAIIGANERPGLANHEPQPTVERFLDFLFPYSAS